jgi:hypothetical protein
MGTRREDEFSGNSNCSDCTPELDSVVIEAFRRNEITEFFPQAMQYFLPFLSNKNFGYNASPFPLGDH